MKSWWNIRLIVNTLPFILLSGFINPGWHQFYQLLLHFDLSVSRISAMNWCPRWKKNYILSNLYLALINAIKSQSSAIAEINTLNINSRKSDNTKNALNKVLIPKNELNLWPRHTIYMICSAFECIFVYMLRFRCLDNAITCCCQNNTVD